VTRDAAGRASSDRSRRRGAILLVGWRECPFASLRTVGRRILVVADEEGARGAADFGQRVCGIVRAASASSTALDEAALAGAVGGGVPTLIVREGARPERRQLLAFARHVLAYDVLGDGPAARLVVDCASRARLSLRETDILCLGVAGASRPRIGDHLGVGENTLKRNLRSLLGKVDAPSLERLASSLLRAAVLGRTGWAGPPAPLDA
jgi:DNA-binding CsgD family transcriptional regulator